ncbi:hypothetical protein [Bacillus sp. T3]|uniref:hypothetical protein n=1 Tax=Bacillus sp. T3 TaxID=467262 RepID=UPI00298118EB|nr:hypothetical protein [Bacillus sp. T3]
MIPSAGIVIVGLLMAWMELPKLFKEQAYKEIIVFSLLLVCGVGLCILVILRIELPNPLDLLLVIFTPISKWIESVLT